MKVVNQCRINFNYQLSSDSAVVCKTIFSNEVSTQIMHHIIVVHKYVDKEEACIFDILIYKIIIENISDVIVTNIFFYDNIPEGVRFIKNSIRINGVKKRCINVEDGFNLGNLRAKESFQVEFKVLVLQSCSCEYIKNHSRIEYDYIYNIEMPPKRICRYSNEVVTKCEDMVFKQITVSDTVKPCGRIEDIIYVDYKVEIIGTEIIESPIKNLCTLLVMGKIEYRIFYKSKFHNKCLEGILGFSENLLVPYGINYCNTKLITVDIENISFELINKDKIFINSNLLLHF